MTRSRVLTALIGALFCLTIVSSARAERVNPDIDIALEKLIFAERHNLAVFSNESAETGYVYAGHFENNNGKHLGFSVASRSFSVASINGNTNGDITLDAVQPQLTTAAIQNPEPTAMVLLGTGLAGIGAFARLINRRRRRL